MFPNVDGNPHLYFHPTKTMEFNSYFMMEFIYIYRKKDNFRHKVFFLHYNKHSNDNQLDELSFISN